MDVLSGDGFMEYVGVSPYRAKWKERMTWKPSIDEWLYACRSMDIKKSEYARPLFFSRDGIF